MIAFDNIKTKKYKCNRGESLILSEDVDIEKIQVSSTVSSDEKIRNNLLVAKMMITKLKHYT